jgi:hypothetical protein
MTKPLTKEQKAANKAARFEKKEKRIEKGNARASKMPTATAKQRAQAAAVALHDAGGSITHALPEPPERGAPPEGNTMHEARIDAVVEAAHSLPAPDTSPNMAQVDERARRKLDKEERAEPLKGVRGRVTPKAAPAAKRNRVLAGAKAEKVVDVPREKKYIDHGTSATHRFEGTMWNGSKVRTAKGGSGLELSTDGGKSWKREMSDAEFYSPNPDRWRRALQQAQRDKSALPPNAAKGQPRASSASSNGSEKPAAARKRATREVDRPAKAPRAQRSHSENGASDAVQSEEERTAWKRAAVSTTCMWGEVIAGQTCKAVSQRRVVCGGGKRFADVCERHEQAFLKTKSSKWVGCFSYPLTPNDVKLDGERRINDVPADQAVSV